MASIQSANQACYVQKESSFGVIPNSSGTASLGNNDACRIITLSTNFRQNLIDRPDKLPTNDFTIGVGGRYNSDWRASMSLAGSGTAGTAPDMDPFLEAWFGAAGVVTASTKVQYDPADTTPSLSIWDFKKPSTAMQKVAFGSIVRTMRVTGGQDVATIDFEGQTYYILDSERYTTITNGDAKKGGLTAGAFPSEPGSPATSGTFVVGFTGAATLDGNSYTDLRTFSINCDSGRELPNDVFNAYLPGTPAIDRRNITGEFSIYADDGANLKSLIAKAYNNTGVTLVFQFGLVAGNIWKFTLRNCLLAVPVEDDSQKRMALNFTYKAHASSATAKDAITLEVL